MKTEVYSWRVSSQLKSDLERAARSRKVPVSKVLHEAAIFWRQAQQPQETDEQLHCRHAAHKQTSGTNGVIVTRRLTARDVPSKPRVPMASAIPSTIRAAARPPASLRHASGTGPVQMLSTI